MSHSVPLLSSLILALALSQSVTSQGASWIPFGTGCAGSGGVPLLEPLPASLPFAGETFLSEVSNLQATGFGVGIIGVSDVRWNSLPLPASLNFLSMPGCVLYTDIKKTTGLSISGGRASWPLVIPDLPALNGLHFFQQALIFDSGAPGQFGAVMSNAGGGVIEVFTGTLTVRVMGGDTGTTPQVGVRVLRHDVVTGAVLDDRLTGVDGIADFGTLHISRSTFSVVVPPPFPGLPGKITTVTNAKVGNLTILAGPVPGLKAAFNVEMTGVPMAGDQVVVLTATPDEGNSFIPLVVTPPTIGITGIEVNHLQPNGRFSILAQAGTDGVGVTGCGMLLDVDPATVALGSKLTIPTSTLPTQVPYVAGEPVFPNGNLVRRNGLIFENGFFTNPATAGNFPVCAIPGADKYVFNFVASDLRGAASLPIFNALPASINVTMPDLSLSGLSRDVAARSFSWALNGSDVGILDMTDFGNEWTDPASGSDLCWEIFTPGGVSELTLPQLPIDLGIFEPPGDSFVDLEMFDFDVVTGYDDFVTSTSAAGGSFVSLALTGSKLNLVFLPN